MLHLLITAGAVAMAVPAAADAPPLGPAGVESPLPPEVAAIVEAAIRSEDPAAVQTVLRFVREAHPGAGAEIDRLHHAFQTDRARKQAQEAEQRRLRLAEAGLFGGWSGQAELGASRSTGSSDSVGLYGALQLDRQGEKWQHKLVARADYQETGKVRSAERLSASWQPRKQLSEDGYFFGLAGYDRDPFLGFDHRFTAALGAGYSLLSREHLRLEVEGGPSLRKSDPVEGDGSLSLGGRASADFVWKVAPTVEFKQQASLYQDDQARTGRSVTAIDSHLLGAFRIRLSHELRYERNNQRSVDRLDTTSRATLVYDF